MVGGSSLLRKPAISVFRLEMEVIYSSETVANTYQITPLVTQYTELYILMIRTKSQFSAFEIKADAKWSPFDESLSYAR